MFSDDLDQIQLLQIMVVKMDVLKLWNEKRWVFWLLLPVVILYFCKDLIFKAMASGARKDIRESQKKDEKLQEESRKSEIESAKHEATADAIEERIENREENGISEDWHKNFER